MTAAPPDWLKQLIPDHRPPAAGIWPPAPGWWILSLLILALLSWFIYRRRQPYRRLY
ncbi:MAG: DUF4381 family protein, partial [Pseudomonadales bacterium]|nr:DUF4381 family protein [Pseudomonadales bacterium]